MRKIIAVIILVCIFIGIFFVSCTSRWFGWVLLHPSNNPPALAGSGFAYNIKSNQAIIFGGMIGGKWSDETWVWDGDWYKMEPSTRPSAREKVAMAYDEARDRVVLFGGSMNKDLFNDTWEWDGSKWQLLSPNHKPPARCCHAMAYDNVQKKVLLYGGWNQHTGEFYKDTWEWDGKDWVELPHGAVPLSSAHSLVDFSSENKVVAIPSSENTNTWEWDGEAWNQIVSHPNPSRADGRSAYDSKYKRVIFFGGIKDGKSLNDTWVFDGQLWKQLKTTTYPPAPRYAAVMFYDAKRQSIILFGGVGSKGLLSDTWELSLPQDLATLLVSETPTP